jgi:hypothetical protein
LRKTFLILETLIENNENNEKHKKFEDSKGVIRNCKLKKNTQYNVQKCEDTKGVIRNCKCSIRVSSIKNVFLK